MPTARRWRRERKWEGASYDEGKDVRATAPAAAPCDEDDPAAASSRKRSALIPPRGLKVPPLLRDRGPDQREGRVWLTPVLWAETVQHDMAIAALDVHHRRLAVELLAAEQPAQEQRVAARRIGQHGRRRRRIRDIERGTRFE